MHKAIPAAQYCSDCFPDATMPVEDPDKVVRSLAKHEATLETVHCEGSFCFFLSHRTFECLNLSDVEHRTLNGCRYGSQTFTDLPIRNDPRLQPFTDRRRRDADRKAPFRKFRTRRFFGTIPPVLPYEPLSPGRPWPRTNASALCPCSKSPMQRNWDDTARRRGRQSVSLR